MNIKVRLKNPVFWIQIALSILNPIFAYAGITAQDITSWAKMGEILLLAITNPYVLALVLVSVWSVCNDPTTKGITDSQRAMKYIKPQ